MKIIKGYKTQLNPNNKQRSKFKKFSVAARCTYNWALSLNKEAHKNGNKRLSAFDLGKAFTQFRKTTDEWWAKKETGIPRSVYNYVFLHADVAYKNFFRNIKEGREPGFPKLKHKRTPYSFSFSVVNSEKDISQKAVKIPRMGWVRLMESNYIPNDKKVYGATVTHYRGTDKWYISYLIEEEIPDYNVGIGEPLGIDVGISSLATCSNGMVIENPRAQQSIQKRKRKKQRQLSRRQGSKKGESKSKNWIKCKKEIGRLEEKSNNVRKNAQHQASALITNVNPKPSSIIVENLNLKGMMKNKKLAYYIQDAGIGEFIRQIQYKAEQKGIKVIKADRWFASSKICSHCGIKNEELTLNQRKWTCSSCGTRHLRDLNAAINLSKYCGKKT